MASNRGLLYVQLQPKEAISAAQFDDWYNNEHGPLLLRFPFIINGLRYQATDLESSGEKTSQKKEWLTIYDVNGIENLNESFFASLSANASPREKAILSELDHSLDLLDLISTREKEGFIPIEDMMKSSDVEISEKRGRVLVTVGMQLTGLENAEVEVGRWYEMEHIPMLMKIPGWLRTRRFKTSDITDPEKPKEYVALHEYENVNGLGGPEHAAAMNTPWRTAVKERFVASQWRRTYSAYHIFSHRPRDLTTLSLLPPSTTANTSQTPSWESPDKEVRTWNGSQPAIESIITTPDGTIIPYRTEGSLSPTAPTILFSNSLLKNWNMWNPFLSSPFGKSLLKTHRILRYNARSSINPLDPKITLNKYTTDILTMLTHLCIPKIEVIIGVSLGGATALNFCLRYPDRVGKFVACDFDIASSDSSISYELSKIYDLRAGGGLAGYKVPGLLVLGEGDGLRGAIGEGVEVRVVEGAGDLDIIERVEVFVDAVREFLG